MSVGRRFEFVRYEKNCGPNSARSSPDWRDVGGNGVRSGSRQPPWGRMVLAAVGFGACLGCADGVGRSSGSDGVPACVPGQVVSCPCLGGAQGVQTCGMDGTFDVCTCPEGTGTSSGGIEEASDGDGSGGTLDLCGDGVEDPGECVVASESYCPWDCEDEGSTGAESCTIFAGSVPDVPSVWEAEGAVGVVAGATLCQAFSGAHVCDFEELVLASADREFDALPAGTTLWVHRTTVTNATGSVTVPDPRSRCADWTYGSNDANDGEYAEVSVTGSLSFILDADPTVASPDLLSCGGTVRAIPCCSEGC